MAFLVITHNDYGVEPTLSGKTNSSLRMDLICLDPSAFATTSRLKAVMALTGESEGSSAYGLAVDDAVYSALDGAILSANRPERDVGALKRLLMEWGERSPILDAEYVETLKILLRKLQPLQSLLERIDEDQIGTLASIDDILGEGSPATERISKNLVRAAAVLKARVLSFSRNAEKHFARLRRVVVARAKGSQAWSKRIKFDIKDRVAAAGWRGKVYVWIVSFALGTTVSSISQNILGSAPSFILMIVTNGSRVPCPNCNRPLHSPSYEFCPWCGHGLGA